MKLPRFTSGYSNSLRYLTLATSLAAMFCLFLRRKYKNEWVNHLLSQSADKVMNYGPLYREYNNIILGSSFDHIELISERKKKIRKEHMVKLKSICSPQFAFELLCLCVLPYPFWDKLIVGAEFDTTQGKKVVVYWFSDIMFAFMFLRLAFLFRTLMSYSQYSGVYSKSLCRKYGFSSNVRFALKCHFTMYPERSFITVFASSVVVLAYLTRIWEIPYLKEINEGDDYETEFF